MTRSEWLEQHGFTKVKDNKVGDWSYKTYQKVYENGDILEIYIEETDTQNTTSRYLFLLFYKY